MDQLSSAALDWALTHILKFGDTDIFPVPFEFDCVKHCWNWLRPRLEKLDLENYKARSHRRMLIPKPDGGFRVATQLDPLDAIIYAALSYEIALDIENGRIPADKRIVFSYRVDLDPSGRLFNKQSGWPEYHKRSSELADDKRYSHVLIADISDFYNQIYSHRVESALETSSIAPSRATNIENFLLQLTARQSRGLPVGPAASILLAEAALNDVDSFLLRQGLPFTRFVDDFRIFCKSRREAIGAHHGLADYLYTSHRLVLEPRKTRILTRATFAERELQDPEELERNARAQKVKEMLAEVLAQSGYELGEDDLLAEDKDKLVRDNLAELFEQCVSKRPLHLGLARHLLRRAARLRTVVLNALVFQNLDHLAPAFREVSNYLVAAVPRKFAAERGAELAEFARSGDYGQIPFLRLWSLEILHNRPDMLAADVAFGLASGFAKELGIRPTALIARAGKRLDWVRSQKESWSNHGPWDRRAVIFSGSTLPASERKPWLGLIEEATDDPLDKAVAQFAAMGLK